MTLCLGTLDRKPTLDERHPCGTPKTTQLLSRELLVFEEKLEVIMSTMQSNRRFGLAGTLILSALSLGALTLSLSPAKAQCLGVRLIPLSQVDQYLGLASQIQNGAGFEFFGS